VIPAVFAGLVRSIAQFEAVRIFARRGAVRQQAEQLVGDLDNVTLWNIDTNDAWVRDHGPMFLTGSSLPKAVVDWGYNAWGEKYPPFDKDDAVPRLIAERCQLPRFDPQMILEGGSVDGNGAGCLLTTASCLLHPRRNSRLACADIEQRLNHFCCARKVVWLSGGDFAGDDTDGHVDQLARFVAPHRVVAAACDNPHDENFAVLSQLHAELSRATDADGQPLEVVSLPIPGPKYQQGHRLPASYCNFYIVNGGLLVPTFNDPADETACRTLSRLFPDRRVVPVPALDLVWGLGACHCLTQQEPA
jgi:agmatine deiminase